MSQIFISYSHRDEAWKDRVTTHLHVPGTLDLWDDQRIAVGEAWLAAIEEAMARASVAMLLVSASFLTSDFIKRKEIPTLLARQQNDGMRVVPVLVKPCAWQAVDWLARLQIRPRGARALSAMAEAEADEHLAALALEVVELLESPRAPSAPKPNTPRPSAPATGAALETWRKKLEFLLTERALAVDASAKFKLDHDITEARAQIRELER